MLTVGTPHFYKSLLMVYIPISERTPWNNGRTSYLRILHKRQETKLLAEILTLIGRVDVYIIKNFLIIHHPSLVTNINIIIQSFDSLYLQLDTLCSLVDYYDSKKYNCYMVINIAHKNISLIKFIKIKYH